VFRGILNVPFDPAEIGWRHTNILLKYRLKDKTFVASVRCLSGSDALFSPAVRNHYDESDVARVVRHLGDRIRSAFAPDQPFNIVGIRTRGEALAERLAQMLKEHGYSHFGRGVLDITLYRDDLSEIGPRPLVQPTQLEIAIDGKPLLLVDDVVFTGRSARSALDLLTDFGRPSAIRLVVLVDRGGRELPIQPDFVGITLQDVPANHRVNVRLKEADGKDEISVEPRT
jgi:pyrimidine operon attenuation protein/uracil phosphoribosyltransferase